MRKLIRTTLATAILLSPAQLHASFEPQQEAQAQASKATGLLDIRGDELSHIVSQPELDLMDARSLRLVCKDLSARKDRFFAQRFHKLYQALGQDMSKAFFHFDFPLWKLEDQMPVGVKKVIHNWYLFGGINFDKENGARTIPDAYRRYCYLMAAARAGHRYAAMEAGQLLMDSVPTVEDKKGDAINKPVIPNIISLDDIAKVVLEYQDPVIRNWEVSNLTSPLVSDQELLGIKNRAGEILPSNTGYFYTIYENCKNSEDVKDNWVKLIAKVSSQYAELIAELDESPKANTPEYIIYRQQLKLMRDNLERHFLKTLIPNYRERVESDELEKLVKKPGFVEAVIAARRIYEMQPDHLKDSVHLDDLYDLMADAHRDVLVGLTVEERALIEGSLLPLNEMQITFEIEFAKYTQDVLKWWEERLEKLDLKWDHIWGSHRLEYYDLPFYWSYMQEFYLMLGNDDKFEDAQRHILSLMLDPEAAKNLAYAVYDRYPVSDIDDAKKLTEGMEQCHQLFIMCGLLGEPNPSDLWEREEAFMPRLLQLAGEVDPDDLLDEGVPTSLWESDEMLLFKQFDTITETIAKRAGVYGLFQKMLPMKAFMFHLALLRNPKHQNTLASAKLFYASPISSLENEEKDEVDQSKINVFRIKELKMLWRAELNAQEAINKR